MDPGRFARLPRHGKRLLLRKPGQTSSRITPSPAAGSRVKRYFQCRDRVLETSGRPSRRGVDRNLGMSTEDDTRAMSPLAQGRGSKRAGAGFGDQRHAVAPRAGAWIETDVSPAPMRRAPVAPRAGAWIETSASRTAGPRVMIVRTPVDRIAERRDGARCCPARVVAGRTASGRAAGKQTLAPWENGDGRTEVME